MTKTARGPSFSPEEDMKIVRLRLCRLTYAEIAARLVLRSIRSVETRHARLTKTGEAARIRIALLEGGADRGA